MKITRISTAGLSLIKQFEGLRLKPYLDSVGVPTIGWGTIRYPNGSIVNINDRAITEAEAESFLQNDVKRFELDVDAMATDALTQNQFDALVSFAYNLGPAALKGSTLLKKVNANASDPTIRMEFIKWVYAGGLVLEGLKKRRIMEADLYFTK